MNAEIFISYSSEDREKIAPIVELISTMQPDRVFQDFLSIRPGEKWADALRIALGNCKTIFVFWCEHSAISHWVREEYEAGIESGKEIIPILLDNTKLPKALAAYQWIDFRRKESHGGLFNFVPGVFRKPTKNAHFYSGDRMSHRDRFQSHEFQRKIDWINSQRIALEEIAQQMASRLSIP